MSRDDRLVIYWEHPVYVAYRFTSDDDTGIQPGPDWFADTLIEAVQKAQATETEYGYSFQSFAPHDLRKESHYGS